MVVENINQDRAEAVAQALSGQPNPNAEAHGVKLSEVVGTTMALGEVHAELLEAGYNVHITPEGRVDLIPPQENTKP